MARRILLVDDDIAEISAVKRVLIHEGHQVVLATNTSDARVLLNEQPPDTILIASACESSDGILFAHRLMREPDHAEIPLVLIGSTSSSDDNMSGTALGTALQSLPVLSQPIDAEVLIKAVQTALARTAPPPPSPSRVEHTQADALKARSEELHRASAPQASVDLAAAWFEDAEAPDTGPNVLTERDFSAVAALPLTPYPIRPSVTDLSAAGTTIEPEQAVDLQRAIATQQATLALEAAAEAEAQRAAIAETARQRILEKAKERGGALFAPASMSGTTRTTRGTPIAPKPLPPSLLEGSLAQTSLPHLLSLVARSRASGRLEIESNGQASRVLWFEWGRLVGARSSAEGEHTEDLALRLGFITREQHRTVFSAAVGLASRRIGVLLFERGFLKSSELALLARRCTEEIVLAGFTALDPYRFHCAEGVPPEERVTLDRPLLALAIDGVRRRWGAAQLDRVLGGPGTLLTPTSSPPPTEELMLTPEEARVAERADGLRTLGELLADIPLDPLSTRQVLAALVEVEALEARVLAPPSDPQDAATSASLDLVRLEAKLDHVRHSDYFTILGINRSSTPLEIRGAAERLLAQLSPECFVDGTKSREILMKMGEIRQVVIEARDILSDDALRAEYIAALDP